MAAEGGGGGERERGRREEGRRDGADNGSVVRAQNTLGMFYSREETQDLHKVGRGEGSEQEEREGRGK